MSAGGAPAAFTVDAGFPGGNILVERTDGDDVYLCQDLRDTEGHWFYWAMRVRGAAGRTLRFHFTGGNVIGQRGPSFSLDGGASWRWLNPAEPDAAGFTFAFPPDADDVRFSMCIPYLESDWLSFVERLGGAGHAAAGRTGKGPAGTGQAGAGQASSAQAGAGQAGTKGFVTGNLGVTEAGRPIDYLQIASPDARPGYLILTARHHACESTANYVLEGLLEAILAAGDDGDWLRERLAICAIPFVDKDGVEAGDQGKNRRPHDHNRDYSGEPIYAGVRAVKQKVAEWARPDRRGLVLDLHCPSLNDPKLYIVGSRLPGMWERQSRFGEALAQVRRGPLPYDPNDNMPYGQGWNVARNYGQGESCAAWCGRQPGVDLATTLEIPYADVKGVEVTAENARALGRDLAPALRLYLS